MDTGSQPFNILVVDDSPVYRKMVENVLAVKGWPMFFAKSGREGIDLFSEYRPRVLITDWMMPDFSGIDLCRHIRENFKEPYTHIIILTANSESDGLLRGLQAGADDYLRKPFNPDELLARVGVACRIIDLHWQLEAKNRYLEELALTDELTGLPNRRALEGWGERQLLGAARHGFPYWVALADLDHFKQVNDKYGHNAGDLVLKRFAEILKNNSRRSNLCGRFGGEEFLFILTHTEEMGARTAVERIRRAFQAQHFALGADDVVVTASFGIAGFSRRHAQTFNQLVEQADVALYAAKRNGRNRMEVAGTEVAVL